MSRTSVLVTMLAVLCAASARAQRAWLTNDTSRNFSLEIGKGFFRSSANIDFGSVILTAQARVPVNARTAITIAIPISHISESGAFSESTSQTAVGNPWIGVELVSKPDLTFEAGIRPGIASDANSAASFLGLLDDFDRFEAWLPKVTSLRATAHMGSIPASGTFVTGKLGGMYALARQGGTSELYADYGVRAGFREPGVLVSLGLTGRARLTHGGSLDDRTVHHLTFIVEGMRGNFRPIASIGTYLDDSAREDVKAIVTVGATIVY